MNHTQKHTQHGFTLVELLIVIAIIGILAAVLVPNLISARSKAVDAAAVAYVRNCFVAVEANRDTVTGQVLLNATTAQRAVAVIGTDYHCTGLIDSAGRRLVEGSTGPNGNGTASVPFGGLFVISANGRVLVGGAPAGDGARTYWYDGNTITQGQTRPQ